MHGAKILPTIDNIGYYSKEAMNFSKNNSMNILLLSKTLNQYNNYINSVVLYC